MRPFPLLFATSLLGQALLAQAPTRLPLGTPLPAFQLQGTDGRVHRSAEAKAPLVLVVFLSVQCPYVRDTEDRINALAKAYAGRMDTFGLNANANTLADEGLGAMKGRSAAKGYAFPYLKDEGGSLAKNLGALCTPDFFLFDRDRRLAYHGRLDDAWGRPGAKRQDLEEAIQALLAGRRPEGAQMPSRGCSIK
ncbi:MAG TPA: thioredoxin family protein [Holophagaceae bacterium]|nr:thioredoxin family protein [Holophagaceae bacterium]